MRVAVSHDQRPIHGSSFLAVCLVANAWFSLIIFIVAGWSHYQQKLFTYQFTAVERAWYASILAFWMAAEGPRLWLGVRSNMTQSGALMFGFLALTGLVHTVLMLVYVFVIPHRSALDVALGSMQMLFAATEVCLGLRAMSTLVTRNTIEFYVSLKRLD